MITLSLDPQNNWLISIQKDGIEVGVAYFFPDGSVSIYEWLTEDRECQRAVADIAANRLSPLDFFRTCTEYFLKKEDFPK